LPCMAKEKAHVYNWLRVFLRAFGNTSPPSRIVDHTVSDAATDDDLPAMLEHILSSVLMENAHTCLGVYYLLQRCCSRLARLRVSLQLSRLL
jgi:hypothetical protein